MQGHVHEFVILFRPGGFSRLFSVPPDELTNRHFEGRAVLGRSVDELRCRLGEAGSFAERVRVADQYLLARAPHCLQSGVIAAARELRQHRGRPRISGLAETAGLSLRQFERRFVSEVGMSPKLYARVARFEAALEIRMRAPGLRWIDIAHDLGYHDQMHMVHDFRQFSGLTPSDLAPLMDLQVAPEIDGAR
jgi:AraC-like DNA-binding protein